MLTFMSWFGPDDCRSQLLTTSLKTLHSFGGVRGMWRTVFVWFVFGASEAGVSEVRVGWEPGASSLFPLHRQLWNSG